MTRKPILYDIHIEEYHVNRVMRQFGVYQHTPFPIVHSVEPHVHRYGIYSSANNSSFFIRYHLALIRSIFALLVDTSRAATRLAVGRQGPSLR